MKIAITTVGTRGDLQPFIALALGLQQAGYEVVLVSSKNEESFVRNYGLNFFALTVDIQKLMEGEEVQEMSKGSNPLKFFISHLKGSKKLEQIMITTQQEIWIGCLDADIIIYHPGMPLGFFMAKELGKISIVANPFPLIPTKDYPSILFYSGPRLGRWYNLITHVIFEKLFWSLSKPALKKFWNTTIKSKMNFSVAPIRQQINSGMPVLNAYSKLLFSQPKEWGDNIHTTGSWLIEKEPNYMPPPELADFIQGGTTPVYIGFGSMKGLDSFKATFEIILQALQITRQRAVIVLGWNSLSYNEPIPKNVFLIDNVPHSWLFPQMSIVIHHGGAGTTAAGLTAGKPTVIISHNADQPAWGRRVFELGVGSKPIKKSGLSADKLATAIFYTLTPSVVLKAEQLGGQLRKENGVAAAVKIVNDYVKENQ